MKRGSGFVLVWPVYKGTGLARCMQVRMGRPKLNNMYQYLDECSVLLCEGHGAGLLSRSGYLYAAAESVNFSSTGIGWSI